MLNAIRPFLLWIGAASISIILIFTGSSDQSKIIKGQLRDLTIVCAYPVISMINVFVTVQENKKLRKLLADMTLDLARHIDLNQENQRLRKMLNFKGKSFYEITAAEVIMLTDDPGSQGIIINRGEIDGIKPDQAVISSNGVVGRVHSVSKRSSVVQTLSDQDIGIAGKILRNGEQGIIHISAYDRLMFDGVPVSETVQINDTIVTTGYGGVFPDNLIIGFVTGWELSVNGWLWDIYVKPKVNIDRLQEVFVIREKMNAN